MHPSLRILFILIELAYIRSFVSSWRIVCVFMNVNVIAMLTIESAVVVFVNVFSTLTPVLSCFSFVCSLGRITRCNLR